MPALLPVLLSVLLAGRLQAQPAESWYRLVAEPVSVPAAVAAENKDWLGEPDWALRVEASDGAWIVFPAEEEQVRFLCSSPEVEGRACILELDPGGCVQIVTISQPLALTGGLQVLSFPDGCRAAITAESFQPEAQSGADATPAGARAIQLGSPAQDRVWFEGGDRTDHWRLTLGEPTTLSGWILSTDTHLRAGWITGADPQPVPRTPTGLLRVEETLPQGDHVLRLRATPREDPGAEAIPYRILLLREGTTTPRELVDALLEMAVFDEEIPRLSRRLGSVLENPQARSALVEGLQREEAGARILAAVLCGELAVAESQSRLEQLASEDPDAEVKRAARGALRALTPEEPGPQGD